MEFSVACILPQLWLCLLRCGSIAPAGPGSSALPVSPTPCLQAFAYLSICLHESTQLCPIPPPLSPCRRQNHSPTDTHVLIPSALGGKRDGGQERGTWHKHQRRTQRPQWHQIECSSLLGRLVATLGLWSLGRAAGTALGPGSSA